MAVIQADRDAAADWWDRRASGAKLAKDIRAGHMDDDDLVLAFEHHRVNRSGREDTIATVDRCGYILGNGLVQGQCTRTRGHRGACSRRTSRPAVYNPVGNQRMGPGHPDWGDGAAEARKHGADSFGALVFDCANCNAGEPDQCMKASHCHHRDGPQCEVLDEDWLSDVIADSLDLDWTPRDGARAILRALASQRIAA